MTGLALRSLGDLASFLPLRVIVSVCQTFSNCRDWFLVSLFFFCCPDHIGSVRLVLILYTPVIFLYYAYTCVFKICNNTQALKAPRPWSALAFKADCRISKACELTENHSKRSEVYVRDMKLVEEICRMVFASFFLTCSCIDLNVWKSNRNPPQKTPELWFILCMALFCFEASSAVYAFCLI